MIIFSFCEWHAIIKEQFQWLSKFFFSDDSSAWEEEEKRHQLPFFPQSIKEGLPICLSHTECFFRLQHLSFHIPIPSQKQVITQVLQLYSGFAKGSRWLHDTGELSLLYTLNPSNPFSIPIQYSVTSWVLVRFLINSFSWLFLGSNNLAPILWHFSFASSKFNFSFTISNRFSLSGSKLLVSGAKMWKRAFVNLCSN